jgi:hypothetical protein
LALLPDMGMSHFINFHFVDLFFIQFNVDVVHVRAFLPQKQNASAKIALMICAMERRLEMWASNAMNNIVML